MRFLVYLRDMILRYSTGMRSGSAGASLLFVPVLHCFCILQDYLFSKFLKNRRAVS